MDWMESQLFTSPDHISAAYILTVERTNNPFIAAVTYNLTI